MAAAARAAPYGGLQPVFAVSRRLSDALIPGGARLMVDAARSVNGGAMARADHP